MKCYEVEVPAGRLPAEGKVDAKARVGELWPFWNCKVFNLIGMEGVTEDDAGKRGRGEIAR